MYGVNHRIPLNVAHPTRVDMILDASIGIAGTPNSAATLAMPLAEMKTTFVGPASIGKIIGRGENPAAANVI